MPFIRTVHRLSDPDDYVLVRSSCMSGGVELHETKDCPRDHTCPVWAAWHPTKV